MERREPVNAIIHWENDPTSMPLNQWIRDLVVILGGIQEPGYTFNLWSGRDVATVTIL